MHHPEHYQQVEQFFDGWQVYKKLLDNNFMYHREIGAAVHAFLADHFVTPFSFLDLGCGDASTSAAFLANTYIDCYIGMDMSQTALQLADSNLAKVVGDRRFVKANYTSGLPQLGSCVDVVYNSYSLHHLNESEKAQYFRNAAQHINDGGYHILVDVTCPLGAEREDYIRMFVDELCRVTAMNDAERQSMTDHVVTSDYPVSEQALRHFADATGMIFRSTLFQQGHFAAYVWQKPRLAAV